MQYLISVLQDHPGFGTAEEQAAIDVFNERLQADGHWVFAGGLGMPDAANAAVVDGRGGKPVVTDGPFAESKEHMIGFWIVEAPSLEVARSLAVEGSKACHRRVELRVFLDAP
jgi:hypothetical protein